MAAIGIISTGTANKGVVKSGLDDTLRAYGGDDGDAEFWLFLAPERKPSSGLTEAYTWLFDKKPYYELLLPAKARESGFDPDLISGAAETFRGEEDEDLDLTVVDRIIEADDPHRIILVMWDDDDTDLQERCVRALDAGCDVLDLTSGLEPIKLNADDEDGSAEDGLDVDAKPEKAKKAPPRKTSAKKDDDAEEKATPPPAGAYTREELEGKQLRQLRSLAVAHGWSGSDMPRDQIIDRLLAETGAPDPDAGKKKGAKPEQELELKAETNGAVPEGMCLVVVHSPDGGIVMRPVSYDKAVEFLQKL